MGDGWRGRSASRREGGWKPLKLGAGGWMTGLSIANDGTKVCRGDVYGAYIWSDALDRWEQLVTADRMPAADVGPLKGEGVFEIQLFPSDPSHIYMVNQGYVFYSSDMGQSFTRTTFVWHDLDANGDYRHYWSKKMAIDPANPSVCYLGTADDGLYYTTDAGDNWSKVSVGDVPDSTSDRGITGILFDPNSGTTGGKTNTLYVCSCGNGVYRTTDAGSNWSALSGGPTIVRDAAMTSDGSYLCVEEGNGVYEYDGSFTDIGDNSDDWVGILSDPGDADRIVLILDNGNMKQTLNRGTSWTGVYSNLDRDSDIPWQEAVQTWMAFGEMLWDPNVSDRIWIAQGDGCLYIDDFTASSNTGDTITWHGQSRGIEMFVVYEIVAPVGGQPVVGISDREVMRCHDRDNYPEYISPEDGDRAHCWSVDWSTEDPDYIIALVNLTSTHDFSGYSSDNGATWTEFGSHAFTTQGGCLAANETDNYVWVTVGATTPKYTKNSGTTWSDVTIAGSPSLTNLFLSQALRRRPVCADRVTSGKFYLYIDDAGLYTSTDGGENFSLTRSGDFGGGDQWHGKLISVPGNAGDLFWSAGKEQNKSFYRSQDAGVSFDTVPDVTHVYAFGFGKTAEWASYPACYIAGYVDAEWGIWRSDDVDQSTPNWTKIGDYPDGWFSTPATVTGDMNRWGTCYVGTHAAGAHYLEL